MKRKIALSWIIVSISVVTCGLAIVSCEGKLDRPAGPPEKVTLAYTTNPNSALVQVALKKGYFAAEGIDIVAQPHLYGKAAVAALVEGKADLATAAETPFIFAVMKGSNIFAVATIQTATKDTAIVVRKDRGINNPQDLKGHKVGVTFGTSGEFFLSSFLTVNAIEQKNITIVDLQPEQTVDALLKGEVDAVSAWNPNVILAQKKLGNNGAIFYGETAFTETFCLTGNQDFVRKNPGAIKKVLKALVRAEKFVKQDPAAAQTIVAEIIGMDVALLADIWPVFNYSVELEQSLLVTLDDVTRWAMRTKLVKEKKMPNYLDFIYMDGLAEVKPEALRIIR
jgi:ABC-type nitrate/sulfonate/bicarbonate transport system substrate-binding protein